MGNTPHEKRALSLSPLSHSSASDVTRSELAAFPNFLTRRLYPFHVPEHKARKEKKGDNGSIVPHRFQHLFAGAFSSNSFLAAFLLSSLAARSNPVMASPLAASRTTSSARGELAAMLPFAAPFKM